MVPHGRRPRRRTGIYRARSYSLWSAAIGSLLKRNDVSIRPPSPRLSQSSPRHLSFFSLSPLFSCSTLYVSTCAKIKREREGEDLPINLPTYLPTYLPTGCYLVTRRGLRLYDSPAVDDVVAPGVGVISTREGTYPPITVTSFSPLRFAVSLPLPLPPSFRSSKHLVTSPLPTPGRAAAAFSRISFSHRRDDEEEGGEEDECARSEEMAFG